MQELDPHPELDDWVVGGCSWPQVHLFGQSCISSILSAPQVGLNVRVAAAAIALASAIVVVAGVRHGNSGGLRDLKRRPFAEVRNVDEAHDRDKRTIVSSSRR